MDKTAPPWMNRTCRHVKLRILSAAAGNGGIKLEERRREKKSRMETSFKACSVVRWHQVALAGALEKTRFRKMVGVTGRA